MTPFFQASRRSLAYQFTVNAPLLWPPFSIFRKFFYFQPCFGQNSSSVDTNFSKFLFQRPPFFNENPFPRPFILKPVWHTSTKKKLSAPRAIIIPSPSTTILSLLPPLILTIPITPGQHITSIHGHGHRRMSPASRVSQESWEHTASFPTYHPPSSSP